MIRWPEYRTKVPFNQQHKTLLASTLQIVVEGRKLEEERTLIYSCKALVLYLCPSVL
jgi:hypothetical protein